MTATTDTHVLLRAFVDELARCGMTHACTSPGSRCAPLVLALAREPRLRCASHIDERCAGFFALGAAKATGRPAAVTCTSGTAAANLLPAVVEAHEARVPLIVLTADRPPELRDVGAGQAIDQLKLYGSAVRWFVEVGTHDATPARLRWIRGLACRAYWTALQGRPGPVHLNFPLREPLVADEALPADESGRPDGAPWVVRRPTSAAADEFLVSLIGQARRPVVVAGRNERGPDRVAEFAARLGAPLLADPLSGARRGSAAIAAYDLLLRDHAFGDGHAPDLVIRCGDLPTSKALRVWLAANAGATQIACDPEAAWQDPDAVVAVSLGGALPEVAAGAADEDWLASWRTADARAQAAVEAELGDELSEPLVARTLGRLLPPKATLVVAASMPVRDVETFWPARDDPPRVLANRGANGIDGTISSALGVAAATDGPVVALIGDVALAHDVGGLLAISRLGLALTIVLVNNGGGGIFDFLAVAGATDVYEQHIATPTGLDFAEVARAYGLGYTLARSAEDLRSAFGDERSNAGAARPTLVEVRSDRAENVEFHRRIAAAACAAISSV